MIKIIYKIKLCLLLLILFTVGCSNGSAPYGASLNTTPTLTLTPIPSEQPTVTITLDPIREQIKLMTLQEKIGQMIIVGIDGETLDPSVEQLIDKYKVGGFILFKRNIASSEQTIDLLNKIKQFNQKANNPPLFFSVDEEGGRVTRMPDEFAKIPSNKVIGSTQNPAFAELMGALIAKEIRSLGFNMDFAPVLDINSNPKNPVIGDRSFSKEQKIVTSLGVSMMKGFTKENVIPVVKHFPGHGDTSVDSHIGLPVIKRNLDELESFELKPFASAIDEGAEVVMVAHLLLPQLDPSYPASLSKAIITDLLRIKLAFEGVVITDDMTMGAIEENYGIGEAVVQSIQAGTDIALICHEYEKEIAAIEAIYRAAEAGTISTERIDDSVYRIMKLKNQYQLTDTNVTETDVKAINDELKQLLDTYITKKK